MEKKRVFVTGMSGYLGGCLCDRLDSADWCECFYGMDRRRPLAKFAKGEFRELDINDPALADWVEENKPDVVIHLAYILEPIKDEALRHRVNVGGTVNLLEAAGRAGAGQVLVASSGTAYGAHADNPVPLKESDALRGNPDFGYAKDKVEVEALLETFAREHPDTAVSVIRPCVIYGQLVNNYLSELLGGTLVPIIRNHEPPIQFVHEKDVVRAIETIIEKRARGPFNVAPPDTVTLFEAARMAGKHVLPVYYRSAKILVGLGWWISRNLSPIPPSFIDYITYPWVMDSSRLTEQLGFEFRYTTRETLEIMFRSKGIIA